MNSPQDPSSQLPGFLIVAQSFQNTSSNLGNLTLVRLSQEASGNSLLVQEETLTFTPGRDSLPHKCTA